DIDFHTCCHLNWIGCWPIYEMRLLPYYDLMDNKTMTTKSDNIHEPIKTNCYNCERETVQDILFQDHEIGPREIIFRTEEGDKSESAWEVVANIWIVSKCR